MRLEVHGPGSSLAVSDSGGPGDPIVLLSGGPGVPDYLGDVERLLGPSRRVLRLDQRGVGDSTAQSGRFSIDDYLGDLNAVREAAGSDRLHLFGHSWGGLLAQLYAYRHPDRVSSLFLCNPSAGVGATWQEMERAVMASNRRASGIVGFLALGWWQLVGMVPGMIGDLGARRIMERVWANYQSPEERTPADPEWLSGVRSQAMRRTRHAVVRSPPEILPNEPIETDIPTLVLFGGRDIYGDTTHYVLERFPKAEHVMLERSGHLPWLQDPEQFALALNRFYPHAEAGN